MREARRCFNVLGLLGLLLHATHTMAADVQVDLDVNVAGDYAAAIGSSLEQMELQLEKGLNDAFSLLDPAAYLNAMSNAQAFSTRGLFADYSSHPKVFVVGAGVNLSLALGEKGLAELESNVPVAGVAPNISLMAGFNFSKLGVKWLTLYVNGFQYTYNQDQLSTTIRNIGVHAQFTLWRPEGDLMKALFRFGGLAITTGFDYSYWGVKLQDTLETVLPLGGEGSPQATFSGIGTFNIENTAYIVPLEVTTSIRLLYVLGLYIGAGVDLQFGQSRMEISLDGPLRAENPSTGDLEELGRLSVNATETGAPTTGKFRALVGLQLNLWMVKLFVQANYQPAATVSLATGLRVAW